MSYDLDLWTRAAPPCPTCKHGVRSERVFDIDPTYNIGGIVRYADKVAFPGATKGRDHGRSFGAIHMKTGTDSLVWLRAVREVMESAKHRKALVALEPSNGWGSLDGTIDVLAKMIAAAESHPDAAWNTSGDGDVKTTRDEEAAFFGWNE